MAKGPSHIYFFYTCAGTILHRRLLRFEPTFLGQTAGALVALITGSSINNEGFRNKKAKAAAVAAAGGGAEGLLGSILAATGTHWWNY